MSSKTFITNLALTNLRLGRINNFETDSSKNGLEARFIYDHARRTALEAFDWAFARKQVALNLSSETVDTWDYVYVIPPDCLVPRRLIPQDLDQSRQPNYEILNIDSIQYLCTDEANLSLLYTKDCEDEAQFSNLFMEALARQMSTHFAIAIKGDAALQAAQLQLFTSIVFTAKSVEAMKDRNKITDKCDLLEYRK